MGHVAPLIVALGASVAVLMMVDRGPRRSPTRHPGSRMAIVPIVAACSVLWPIPTLMASVAIVSIGFIVRSERRRRKELDRALRTPVVVELLARQLSTGETVAGSLRYLNQEQIETIGMASVRSRIEAGESVRSAMPASVGPVGAALLAAELAGTSSGSTVERLADRLRAHSLDGQTARSESGQQLASAVVMAALPPLASAIYAATDHRAADFYFRSIAGVIVLGVSFMLSAASWLWMRFLTRPRVAL